MEKLLKWNPKDRLSISKFLEMLDSNNQGGLKETIKGRIDNLKEKQQKAIKKRIESYAALDLKTTLECLNLTDYYPQKISLDDIRLEIQSIESNENKMEECPNREIAWHLLHQIFQGQVGRIRKYLDYQKPRSKARKISYVSPVGRNSVLQDSVHKISPRNVLICLFLCSTSELQRFLAEKLRKSLLSFPLFLPDNNNGSSKLRILQMNLRSLEFEGNKTKEYKRLIEENVKVVSFLSICSRSCHRLLNETIERILESQTQSKMFLGSHENIALNKVSQGYVDMGVVTTKQNEPIIFLRWNNLPEKIQSLFELSSIVVLLVTKNIEVEGHDENKNAKSLLNEEKNDVPPFYFVFPAEEQYFALEDLNKSLGVNFPENSGIFYEDGVQDLSESISLPSGLCKRLYDKLGLEESRYVSDYDSEVKKHAETILDTNLGEEPRSCLKAQNFLHEWEKLNKDLHRSKEGNDDLKKIRKDMLRFSGKIHSACNDKSDVMERFIDYFNGKVNTARLLDELKFLLDYRCGKNKPKLEEEYNRRYNAYTQSRSTDKMEEARQNWEEIERKIVNSNYGVEHLIRELGIMYDHLENKNVKWPSMMADLLLQGQPLELFNGDASHVPLEWIKAILQELKKKIGEKKIFILSILGVQSSGKSTLLNNMFGLNLAVSAGRCTRGIFGQLLPIKPVNEMEYLLVLDTEGLRAPEQQSEKYLHDHEIATFAIGLAHTTLINIKGEILGDMENVLHIVVHAFLRISLVQSKLKLLPSVFFAHQNFETNEDHLKTAHKRLIGQLDKMAKDAGEYHNVSNIKTFEDIIKFDANKDVSGFPNLWFGNPPNASINDEYIGRAASLKQKIYEAMSPHEGLTISDISEKIQDLWYAILNENFIFSFRNNSEIRTHRKFDSFINDLCFKMQAKSFQISRKGKEDVRNQHKQGTLLKSVVDQVKSNAENRFCSFYDENIAQVYRKFKENENSLSNESGDPFEKTLSDEKNECIKNIEKQLNNETQILESTINIYRREIMQQLTIKAKKGTEKLNSQDVVKEILSQFIEDKSKQNEFNEYERETKKEVDKITSDIKEAFKTKIGKDKTYLITNNTNLNVEKDWVDKAFQISDWIWRQEPDLNLLKGQIEKLEIKLKKEIEKDYLGWDRSYATDLVSTISYEVYQEQWTGFKLTEKARVRTIQYLVHKLTDTNLRCYENRRKKSNPLKLLNNMEKELITFYDLVAAKTISVEKASGYFWTTIREHVEEKYKALLKDILEGKLKSNYEELRSKQKFVEARQGHLLHRNNFSDFYTYIHSKRTSFKQYVGDKIKDLREQSPNLDSFRQETEVKMADELEGIIDKAFQNTANSTGLHFLEVAIEESMSYLDLKMNPLNEISQFYSTEIPAESIRNHLLQFLRSKLKEFGNSVESEKISSFLHKKIYRSLLGCRNECLLCGVQCELPKNHFDSCKSNYHWPVGLSGRKTVSSKQLLSETCHILIKDPTKHKIGGNDKITYKEYINIHAHEWYIRPNDKAKGQAFVKKLFHDHSKEFEKHYGAKIPWQVKEWKNISKEEALRSIRFHSN